MNEAVPFNTDDAVLAASLYAAGVPEYQPPTNTFTAESLKRLGYRGMALMEAARAACKKGDRGRVEYWFEQTPELPHFLAAYRDQQAQINAEGENIDVGEALRGIMAQNAAGTMDEREALLRISCITLKCRIQFVNRWKDYPARLDIPDEGEAVSVGPNTTRYPGGKNVPVTMSDEQLAKLGL